MASERVRRCGIHHVELWVSDLDRSRPSWGWLLETLGFEVDRTWRDGVSWRLGDVSIVIESSPETSGEHDRMRAGLNHLALWGGGRSDVDRTVDNGPAHGWTLLFADRQSFAGGPDHYAAYLENSDGFEVELVADG